MKECNKCGLSKRENEFTYDKRRSDRKSRFCKKCQSEINSISWNKNKNKYKDRKRKYDLLRDHGITYDEYLEVLINQNYSCKICGDKPNGLGVNGMFLHVDHDHSNGAIRGLLCNRCNLGLGLFRDNCKYLSNAIEYLTSNINLVF